jgi:hypothetical protein
MKIVLIEAFNDYLEKEYFLDKWEDIEELFDSIDWTKFHIFTIFYDDNNSIDISGNTLEDGLSASLTRDGEIKIIPTAPQNLTFCKVILRSFILNRDSAFEKFFKETNVLWVRPKRKEDRFFRWIMVLFFSSIILVPIIYFSWNDLKFIGREVGYSRAKAVDIKMESYGGRFFWQIVNYEFEVDGMVYPGNFKGGSRQGYTNLDDEFKIRYLLSNPEVNDFVGRYVKKKKILNSSSKKAKKPNSQIEARSKNQTENANLDSININ